MLRDDNQCGAEELIKRIERGGRLIKAIYDADDDVGEVDELEAADAKAMRAYAEDISNAAAELEERLAIRVKMDEGKLPVDTETLADCRPTP